MSQARCVRIGRSWGRLCVRHPRRNTTGPSPGQGETLRQELGPANVRCEVPVAEVEPSINAVTSEHGQGFESITLEAPAGFRVGKAGKGIHHGVKVWRNMQAVKNLVVAGVHPNHKFSRLEAMRQANNQLGATDSSGEGQDPGTVHLTDPNARRSVQLRNGTRIKGRNRLATVRVSRVRHQPAVHVADVRSDRSRA